MSIWINDDVNVYLSSDAMLVIGILAMVLIVASYVLATAVQRRLERETRALETAVLMLQESHDMP